MNCGNRSAVSPLVSAKSVLLEEFAASSATFRNEARSVVLVRPKDCSSASTGLFIIATAIHFPSAARTIGPWCVRKTVKLLLTMVPAGVR